MCRKILCYGDSNTYGYDPRSYLGGRYPETVRWTALLEKQGWIVFNEGENGRSIPQRERAVHSVVQMVEQLKPEITAVMLGSNDLLQDPRLSAEECALRMERFMQMLLEQSRTCKFLLIAPPPMTLGSWISEKAMVQTSQGLGTYYKAAAQRLAVSFADAGEWQIDLTFDGVHFSEQGHLIFANKIGKRFEELLGDMV